MKTNPISQHGAAIALVQLLEEHPELQAAGWSIDPAAPVLHGHLHEGGMEALNAYTAVLGGAPQMSHEYEFQGQRLRSYWLRTTWRDVQVEVAVVLPVAESAQVAA